MATKVQDWNAPEARAHADSLAAELRATITGEVRFDDGTRALYAVDGSNYRQVPIGIVIPKTIEEVIQTVALARKHNAPLASARRRHQPLRTVLQRRRDRGFLQVPEPDH